jgi:hypothetical protein
MEECHCPRQSMPPPLLTTFPFHPTEENMEKLEKWILEQYKDST